ncbi:MAG: hypothetical protein AAF719_11970 [Pseudomonadota bacterium]
MMIEKDRNLSRMSKSALWPGGTHRLVSDAWSKLVTSLPTDENWQVWTDWYGERLHGFPNGPPIMELERERVLVSNEDWAKGPAHVNAIIAEIEAKYRHPAADVWLPREDERPAALSDPISDEEAAQQVQQSPAGTRVKRGPDGRFIVDPDPPTENAAQQERHAGLRDLLEELLDVCAGYRGNQLPLRIVKNARALLDALGAELAAMDVEKTARHGLILRVHAEREEGAQAEDRLGEREFPKDVAPVLFGARDGYNRLAIGDDALLAADIEAAGPDAQDLDAERAAADKLFNTVFSTADEVLTPELIDVLKDERDLAAEASDETGPAADRAQRRWIATATNVVRAFAESVLSYSDKAKRAGKRLIKDADRRVFDWVKTYKDVLKPLLNDRSVRKALWALIERRIKAEEKREASDDPRDKDR